MSDNYSPLPGSYESITVSATAVGLSATKYQAGDSTTTIRRLVAEEALITVEGDSIRWTTDGTTPTASVGHLAPVSSAIALTGLDSIRRFRAIRVTTDATLRVSYFGS